MKEAKIVKESGNFIIKKNGHVLRDIFDKPMVLRFFNQTSNKAFLNSIFINPHYKDRIINPYKTCLLNPGNGEFFECSVCFSESVDVNGIIITKLIQEKLSIEAGTELILLPMKSIFCTKILIASIDDIKEKKIRVSAEKRSFYNDFVYYDIVNTLTGASMTIKNDKILFDPNIAENEIKLNRQQRVLLDIELPPSFEDNVFLSVREALSSDEEKELLFECYNEDGSQKKSTDYRSLIKLKKKLEEKGLLCLSISPTIRSFHSKNDVSLFRKITRFIVGKSIKALKCVRPYSEDEDSNIVRISTDNMKVLGLDDTGKVVITYGMQSVLCKALPYENEERLLKTNKDINVETSIGIPINLRKKLGICKLNVSVKVERDTNSIFKLESANHFYLPYLLCMVRL